MQTPKCISSHEYSPRWMANQRCHLNRIDVLSTSYRQSSSTLSFSTSSDANDHDPAPSNRSKFKEIPVNPSILSYIESIGIGIPKRNPTKRRLNRLRKNKGSKGSSKFLTREEEVERLLPSIRRMPSRIPPPPFAMPQSKSINQASLEMEGKQSSSRQSMDHKKKSSNTFDSKKKWMKNEKNTPQTTKQDSPNDERNPPPQVQRSIRRYPVTCIASVGTEDDDSFPSGSLKIPEVAIAGRSNVGKSTLLNALLYGNHPKAATPEGDTVPFRRQKRGPKPTFRTARLPKGLKAITSSKPGQTRTIDFYRLTAKVISTSAMDDEEPEQVDETMKISLQLVDLPGYGFAYATEDKMDAWKSLMQDYILNRGKPLKRVLLLIDARHGMKIADIEFLESLQQALLKQAVVKSQDRTTKKKRELPPIQIVLTKCDLVSQADLARRVVQVQEQLSDCLIRQPSALPVMLVSAQIEGQRGVLELQKELASLVPGIRVATDLVS